MQEAVSSGVAQTRELTEAMERGIHASESISGQFGDIIQRVESMVPRYEAVSYTHLDVYKRQIRPYRQTWTAAVIAG